MKWIESAGGRVVPLPFKSGTMDNATLEATFHSLNGILYPGGAGFMASSNAKRMYDMAVAENQKGGFYPIWATCGGFETLLEWTGHGASTLDRGFDSENISLALELQDAAKSSRLFAAASSEIMDIIGTKPVTMNNHGFGISPTSFAGNSNITEIFTVLSLNKDRKGKSFVSTMEAKTVPVYATQWHPEKNAFEWGMRDDGELYEAINHDEDAVKITQYTADFFVSECRKNSNKFATPAEEAAKLIYNYSPSFLKYPEFVQSYEFSW